MSKYLPWTLIGVALLTSGFLYFAPVTLGAEATAEDSYTIFVDNNALPPGDGTREKPYNDMHMALQAVADPLRDIREVQMTGTFIPVILDPELHSGTPEQWLTFKGWEGRPTPEFVGTEVSSGFSTNGTDYLIFENMIFRDAQAPVGGIGLFINNSEYVHVNNITSTNNREAGTCLSFSRHIIIENSNYSNNQGNGLLIPGVDDVIVRNSIFNENSIEGAYSAGISVNSSSNVQILNNEIARNGHNGLRFSSGTGSHIYANNRIFDNAENGMDIGEAPDVQILNNFIVGNHRNGINQQLYGTSNQQHFIGNVIANNQFVGLQLAVSSDNTVNVLNNTILQNGISGIDFTEQNADLRFHNNIIAGHPTGVVISRFSGDADIVSDFNNVYNNAENLIYYRGPARFGWEDWLMAGHDAHSRRIDPLFSDEMTCAGETCIQFHLSPSSRLINAGKQLQGSLPPTDIDGDARYNRRVDYGADEYVAPEI
ncbi:MAG: right-handed parallel beta-helix repeat-containing protein [Candidatus Kerfeldbacteria bacterium]|nr:right-handed parallel beta-helix repeat-containing protein [Candidatus Kerfeldbacteria bacterium]